MGNYIWDTDALIEELRRDAESDEGESQHDFGKNILPSLVDRVPVAVYDFQKNELPGQEEREHGYWRDVGTLRSYFEANMELISVHPVFNLYNQRWPIRGWTKPSPPAKFVFADSQRMGIATDSLVSEGCIVSGGRIDRSVLSPNVHVHSYSHVEQSILFEEVQIMRHARVRRAIVDKNVVVPEGYHIGFDHDADRRMGLTVSDEDDLVVVPKGHRF
jgi:glucose-1-phosphate adenylyltransferase